MKLLVITRLFSGLAHSFETNTWEPKGMPAFSKLLEAMDGNEISADLLLFDDSILTNQTKKAIVLKGLRNLRFSTYHPLKIGQSKFARFFQEITKILIVFYHLLKKRKEYHLIYVDRSHVLIAALLKIIGYKVVLRLYGVSELYQYLTYLGQTNKINFYHWAFSRRFDYIIGSKDGSPTLKFIKDFCSPAHSLVCLNGVDLSHVRPIKTRIHPIITFTTVSRIDEGKGVDKIVTAFMQLSSDVSAKLQIIGDGPLKSKLEAVVQGSPFRGKIEFMGSVKHAEVLRLLSSVHVFISLNEKGNLSNVMLEAMGTGNCIITYGPDEKEFRDEQFNFRPEESPFILIKKDADITGQLKKEMERLIENPNLISEYQVRTKKYAKENLRSWEERLKEEIEILKIVAGHP